MEEVPPNAADDFASLTESEAAGDVDGNVRDNDTNPSGPALPVFSVGGSAANVGATIAGSDGGTFKINADGSYDFDAAGAFDDLDAGETRTTSVTYAITFTGAADVVDVVLLQDLSGSFGDDLPNVSAQFGGLYDSLNAIRDVDFGVASFVDKPFDPFGGIGDYTYQTELAVTGDKAAVQAALDGLVLRFGLDAPESQSEALLQLAARAESGEISFRDGAQRIVVLTTDAESHFAPDNASSGPNDGDAVIEDEDYPTLAQVKAALEAADITPIFSVTSGVVGYYEDLVVQLGRGVVVTLSSDSSNLASAISDALTNEVETIDTATLTVTVTGEGGDPPPPSECPTVDRAGTVDGSAPTNDVLVGPDYHNTYFFDVAASTGDDRITNFEKDDILVTTVKLFDGNKDDIIQFGNGVLDFDGPNAGVDTVTIDTINPSKGLRYLGESCPDVFVYADATVRPFKAIESSVADDVLKGDAADSKSQTFFFDTALDISLGLDSVTMFGAKDIFVTTSKITDADLSGVVTFGGNDKVDLSGGVGGPDDPGPAGEVGTVTVSGIDAATITAFEYDGSVNRDGVDYFVYSLVGSAAGTGTLVFA